MSDKPWIQLNFKTPAGSLINLYAQNLMELDDGMTALEERAGRIADVERLLGATGTVNQVFSQPPAQGAPQPYVPQQRQYNGGGGYGGGGQQEGLPRPAGPAPFLPNGQEAQWKSGISKSGKAYGGWYDPNTKSFLR